MAVDLKALHQQALDQFKLVVETEKDQRAREQEDLNFDAGDQWPPEVAQARQGVEGGQGQPAVPARPMLTIRTLDQPTAQVVNQARNARFTVKITAKDDADPKTAEVLQGLLRAQEYDSHAQTAYLWAYMRAVVCGRGYFRVNKAWAVDDLDDSEPSPAISDQVVTVEMILNGASVYIDPWAQAVNDPAAAEWAMVTQDIPESQYKRDYDDTNLAQMTESELTSRGNDKDAWIKAGEDGERIFRIAERFYTVYETKKVPNPGNPDQPREITKRRIMWGKLNGVEWIQQPQEWDGKFIPIIPVIGNEKNVGGKRLWEGIVRPNIGPCRMINYLVSKDAEDGGLMTKAPWVGVKGQFEGLEAQWEQANTRNQPWLEYNAITDATGANILGAPVRNVPQYPSSSEAIGMYVNFVRSTTGVPDAALGHVNANDKSGKAIAQLQQASEQGTSNFPDNLQRAIQHSGLVRLDLTAKIYDRPGRIVRILTGQDDEQSTVMLNQPFVRQQGQPMAAPPGSVPGQPAPGMPPGSSAQPGAPPMPPMVEQYDLAKGQYGVIVEVGKSFATKRAESMAGLSALAEAEPQMVPRFADLWVKAMDIPESEAIAERLKPPGVDDNLPPQVQQAMSQMQQENQQLKMALQTKQVESQAKLQEAAMDNASREKIAMINVSAQVGIAEGKLNAENARTYLEALERRFSQTLDLHMAKLKEVTDRMHEQHLQAQGQAHDVGMAAMQQQHDLAQAQQAHEQGLVAADQGHQQAVDLASQAQSAQNSEPTA